MTVRAADGTRAMPDDVDGVQPLQDARLWPEIGRGPVLFLLDVRDEEERALLEDRIRAGSLAAGSAHAIAGLDEEPAALRARLAALPGEAWLQPLRLIWLPRPGTGASNLLQDLLALVSERPGARRRRRILAAEPERVRVLRGDGARLEDVRAEAVRSWGAEAEGEVLAAFVRRQALLVLDRVERNARGARYKVPRLLPEDVFANRDFRTRLWQVAQEAERDPADVEREATEYLEEMAATQTPLTLDALVAIMRAMYTASHEREIDVVAAQLEQIEDLVRSRPVAFVMSHKSMLDSVALQCVLFDRNQPMPLTFGGINLATPGIGALAKRAGVIFLRRSFQDNEIYKSVFRRYIDWLIEKRFSLLWALEGTRSRTGKLLPPRYGLFNYVVEAILRTGMRRLAFVPVNITYDQVPEVGDYVIEQQGRDKRAEGAGWFLRFIRERRPHGRIFLRFGAPLVLDDVAPEGALDAAPEARQQVVQKLAFETAVRMNDATPITPVAVVTMILLAAGHRAQTLANIQYLARPGMALVRKRRIEIVGRSDFRDPEAVRETLAQLHATGVVAYHDQGEERLYGIAEDAHLKAAYYRNTIIHYFVSDAFCEVALLRAAGRDEDAFWREMDALRDLFKHEFYFRLRDAWIDRAEARLALRFRRWRSVLPEGEEAVLAMLGSVRPLFAHALLRSFTDAYSVIARRLARLEGAAAPERRLLVGDCLRLGRQLRLEGRIFSEESVSRALFETALKLAEQRGLTGAAPGVDGARLAFLEELADLGARLDVILDLTTRRTLAQEL